MNRKTILARVRRKKSNEKYQQTQKELISELEFNERLAFEINHKYFISKESELPNEKWVPLKDWEGIYKISQFGRIKGGPRNILKTPHLHHSGYYTTSLHRDKKKKYVIYSRLIGYNFIENPNNLPEMNHKNKIRIDNRICNLEWSTSENNSKHRAVSLKEHTRKPIIQMDKDGVKITEWPSIYEAAKSLKIRASNLSSTLKGVYKSCGGFKWQYNDK